MTDLLNEQQAAEYLNCSVALLRKWRVFGGGPPYSKIGRLVRYREADLATYVNAHRIEGKGKWAIASGD